MPVFAYRARTVAGGAERGLVDAESVRSAWQQLRARGVFPTEVLASDARPRGARVAPAERAAAIRQLASLVQAGVPIADALEAVVAESRVPALRDTLTVVRARLREGSALADALAACPGTFPPLWQALVRAGETSGALGTVLARLARESEHAAERRARLRTALLYPAAMVTVTSLVLAFLLVRVVPEVTRLFAETGAPLPFATRALVAVSAAARATWWLWLAAGALAVAAGRRWLATPAGRRRLDAAVVRLPLVGPLAATRGVAQVARTLAMTLAHGLPLDRGLELAAGTAGNAVVGDAVQRVRDAVRRGEPLAPALGAEPLFPATLRHLVATGERTGTLAGAFEHAAAAHDAEVERAIDGATALVEPALVVVMGAAVLVLVLAILVPILTLDPLGGHP
jgi:general secretion pathway protein F